MMHKRGLSPQELEELDPDVFNALHIYDTLIEPNGSKIEMMKHANLLHTILLTSQSITKEGRQKADIHDWDFLDILGDDSLTSQEKLKVREAEKLGKSKSNAESFAEMVKALAEGSKNGKKPKN
ncbi:hypothetical protein [Kluyvera georgiana]|uniref:hypothetical protein n=1 Tax=Kluyvera georgiana TaxID=73098 RepID=UPI003AF00270